jgi:hypothetical protein
LAAKTHVRNSPSLPAKISSVPVYQSQGIVSELMIGVGLCGDRVFATCLLVSDLTQSISGITPVKWEVVKGYLVGGCALYSILYSIPCPRLIDLL